MTASRPSRLTPLCLAVGLAFASGVLHAAPRARPVTALAVVAATPAAEDADRRYESAVLEGRLADTYRALDAEAAAAPPRQRADVLLTIARIQWREGRWSDSDSTVDRAMAVMPSPAAWRLKGELLDAGGQPRQALAWLQKARDASPDARQREALALRIAVMQAAGGDAVALERWAAQAPAASRWRGALVLGLLGQPGRALALAESLPAASFEDELRMSDWALRADDAARARRHAWAAVERAGATAERRYALALWVEAWRAAHDLGGAVDALARVPATAEFTQTRVDLLLELGRADDALTLVEKSADPALRQRLTTVLQATGRTADVEREYRRLIAEQPGDLRWVQALAELRLAQDDKAGAVRIYQQLLERSRQQPDVVIAGVRSMIARGLADDAMAMLGRVPSSPALAQATRGLLFERYLDQGQEASALVILESWRDALSAASPEMADIAEGYERLGRRAQALTTLQAWQAAGGRLDDDQLAHVAELLSATGQEPQALAQWRTLWTRARLPARKDFLERKIVGTAQRLGQVAAMADELQARLDGGQASADEISLLMSLRIASFDGPGVQAAVRAYARQGKLSEQARLEQLARVYARMRDAPALVQTLRSLARLDPAGAPDYLRQALQTLLQQPDSRPTAQAAGQGGRLKGDVGEIVAELQAASGLGSAENSRYLAGIYAASGLSDQALALYRRALAQAPRDGDNLLQLADALKSDGKVLEATALLQQSALRAGTAGDFATAISGLLDLFGNDPDGRVDGEASLGLKSSRLSWALRQVLTRIAETGDDMRFNSLVADIALSQENAALQLRAYEAGLPAAQDQRAAVLRQLIALTSEQKGGAPGVASRASDLPRKIAFGRRLIALRQDFAASVYVDLARAMLAQGDLPGAELAFSMVDDNAGLTNVAALRAAAYAEVGRNDEALASYRLALLRDPDDAATIVAASILRESQGQTGLAWVDYWRGLVGLLSRQPLLSDGLSEAAALDATQYLPTLLEGVLLNWPADEATSTRALAAWRQLFEQTMAQVDRARPLSEQTRMQSLLRVNRRLAAEVTPAAGLPALEDTLAQRLADDRAFALDRAAQAHRVGTAAPSEGTASADWPLLALRLQAADQDQASLSLLLALMQGDEGAVQQIAQRALAAETAGRKALQANVVQPPGALGAWIGAVRSAVGRLPADRLDALLIRPLDASPYRDEVLFDLYRGDLASFEALEQALGRRLLDSPTLMTLLTTRSGTPLPEAAMRRGATPPPSAAGAALARFSIDEQLTLQERMVAAMAHGGGTSSLLDDVLHALLRQPLDDTQRARLLAVTAQMTAVTSSGDEIGVPAVAAGNIRRLLMLDLPPAGQALLLEMAGRFARQVPEAASLPAFLQGWYAGDNDAAYRAWLGLQGALRDMPNASPLQMPQVAARFEAERKRDVEAFLALPKPDVAEATRFYQRHVLMEAGGAGLSPTELAVRYRALLRAVPDSPVYLGGLLMMDLQRRDLAGFAQDLRPYVRSQPGDVDAAALLALAERILGEPQRAAEIASAAGVDLDDPDWLVAMWDLGRTARPGDGAGALRVFFPAMFDVYRNNAAMPPAVLAALPDRLKPSTGQEPVAEADAGPWQALLGVPVEGPSAWPALRGRLRERWRESLGGGEAERGGRAPLVAALPGLYTVPGEPPETSRLRQLFLRRPEVSDELDAALRALEPAARQSQGSMYTLLAHGLVRQGRADERRQGLLAALSQGQLDGHGLQLLGTLVEAQRRGLAPQELALLEARLQRQPAMAPAERLLFARVFARSGQEGIAEAYLRAAVLQLLYPGQQDSGADVAAPPTLAQASAVLSLWKDQHRAAVVHQALVDLVSDSRVRDATGGRHPEAFPPVPSSKPVVTSP